MERKKKRSRALDERMNENSCCGTSAQFGRFGSMSQLRGDAMNAAPLLSYRLFWTRSTINYGVSVVPLRAWPDRMKCQWGWGACALPHSTINI